METKICRHLWRVEAEHADATVDAHCLQCGQHRKFPVPASRRKTALKRVVAETWVSARRDSGPRQESDGRHYAGAKTHDAHRSSGC